MNKSITYKLINNNEDGIKVVVDADSVSATISWTYEATIKEDRCRSYKVKGNASWHIGLSANTTCDSVTTSGTILWEDHYADNGEELKIPFVITQKPYITDKPTEYIINTIDGYKVKDGNVVFDYTFNCGEKVLKDLDVNYSAITYQNNCDEIGKTSSGTTTIPFVFDCTNGNSGIINILGQDITYEYNKCNECVIYEMEDDKGGISDCNDTTVTFTVNEIKL